MGAATHVDSLLHRCQQSHNPVQKLSSDSQLRFAANGTGSRPGLHVVQVVAPWKENPQTRKAQMNRRSFFKSLALLAAAPRLFNRLGPGALEAEVDSIGA
jgi:hypothetical protein